jgi:hypothetical protein
LSEGCIRKFKWTPFFKKKKKKEKVKGSVLIGKVLEDSHQD